MPLLAPGDLQALIGERMLECYRTPAGKQERQAQVEPLRREVRNSMVGAPRAGDNGSAPAASSNGASPSAAAYTDSDVNGVLKVRLGCCCAGNGCQ
jgi:hypothetical protein